MLLCRTMARFYVISIDKGVDKGGVYCCAHYILWRLPLCALLLCSMTHYITSQWVMVLLEMLIVTSQWI